MCTLEDRDLMRAEDDGMITVPVDRESVGVGQEILGMIHHRGCNCGCAFVLGLRGKVIEVAVGVVVAEFHRPSLTSGRPRRHLAAFAVQEVARAPRRLVAGTQVRPLLPHRGDWGTIVGYDEDLLLPLIEWGEDPATREACEPGEFEVIA